MQDRTTVDVEFESRALVKLQRAAEHFHTLEAAIDRWNDEHQLLAPARSPHDGEQRVEFYKPAELDDLPLASWESTFHDGVHNIRAALDVFCSEMAHLEGVPSNPRRISFPVTEHPNQWPNATKHLDSMPAEILERLRQCQSWGRSDPQEPDPLLLISNLDNWDKHRTVGAQIDTMPYGQWAYRPEAPIPPELANSADWPYPIWMRMSVSPPIDRGVAALMPVGAVPIVIFGGLIATVPDAQRWLHSEASRMIRFVASGEWPEAGFPRFQPGPVWWPMS